MQETGISITTGYEVEYVGPHGESTFEQKKFPTAEDAVEYCYAKMGVDAENMPEYTFSGRHVLEFEEEDLNTEEAGDDILQIKKDLLELMKLVKNLQSQVNGLKGAKAKADKKVIMPDGPDKKRS